MVDNSSVFCLLMPDDSEIKTIFYVTIINNLKCEVGPFSLSGVVCMCVIPLIWNLKCIIVLRSRVRSIYPGIS